MTNMDPVKEGARLAMADAAMHLAAEVQKFADEALNDEPSDVCIEDIADWIEYWNRCVAVYRQHYPKKVKT